MGKKVKIGKQRRDKFYYLAKETGFRARSAFKLIQLNRKFNFLQKARVCIDLCAAPGGWMQVAVKEMPMSSLVVGVDLVPIRPIKGCIGITADITTEKCRQLLRKEIKHLKADVVLHDGAPNVGSAWTQDAFTQAGLVLHSLKLATEFLKEGGTFVSKVFRSRDYQSLMWVFNQLFGKVHATKPVSSRNESAEIFVVCQDYLAPAKIDPKMLDARYVFQEIDAPVQKQDLFHPEKQRRQRGGYEDGVTMLYKEVPAETFIKGDNYLDLLSSYSAITFSPDSELLAFPETSDDIKHMCADLKVLGKKDFKVLCKWRLALRDKLYRQDDAAEAAPHEEEKEEEEDEESKLQRELAEMGEAEARKAKQLKRRLLRQKAKLRERMSLQMDVPVDTADIVADHRLFHLQVIKSAEGLKAVDNGDWDKFEEDDDPLYMENEELSGRYRHLRPYLENWDGTLYDEEAARKLREGKRKGGEGESSDSDDADEEDEELARQRVLEETLEREYQSYLERKGGRHKRVRVGNRTRYVDIEQRPEEGPEQDAAVVAAAVKVQEQAQPDSEGDDEDEEGGNPLLHDEKVPRSRRAALWFSQQQFADLESEEEDEVEEEEEEHLKKGKGAAKAAKTKAKAEEAVPKDTRKRKTEEDSDEEDEAGEADSDVDSITLSDLDSELGSHAGDDSDSNSDSEAADPSGFEEVSAASSNNSHPPKPVGRNLDAEGLAIAAQMIARRRKAELIDQAYNRYTFNDDPLPEWFADEEGRHRVPTLPITKEMADEIKARQREIDARPIKKVLQAKARKKRVVNRKMEKVKQKATLISENDTLTEKEKSKQIQQLYNKLKLKEKKETTYVVTKKINAAKRPHRPKGVTGFYKVVDKRMKADKRGEKSAERKRLKRKKH
eukprot:m.57080 g.57080  ORF g.57080 m.57080 type:complete len:893 (+) comp15767_c1_seq1:91-2769(+)